ncbi:hypothetical protein NL676_008236 [Syzygium grande]|nr:hypothetical protein NL676_008236 [Syzygium grande]
MPDGGWPARTRGERCARRAAPSLVGAANNQQRVVVIAEDRDGSSTPEREQRCSSGVGIGLLDAGNVAETRQNHQETPQLVTEGQKHAGRL